MAAFSAKLCKPSVKYDKKGRAICRVVLETTDDPHELADTLARIINASVAVSITLEQRRMEE